MTLIENEKYQKAIDEFNYLIINYDNYNIESRWYLALCYLKLEKTEKAKILFKELSLSKNYYQKSALKILKKID
ncbi:MAG: hypothetical protein JXR51_07560 [Bacteroidales bacterium]|nr:hypothetical protein [Bacteroidales bacterium]MBN2757020.1 hypothetical protein [Bacteroidales bacterium]